MSFGPFAVGLGKGYTSPALASLLPQNNNQSKMIELFSANVMSSKGLVISISRNGLLKSCARFVIERSEIRKKEHDFKSVHFECRMVLFYMIWEKSRL